ncbi:sigma 54-interacting transcriptional regulator, partial [Bacillus paralicheniformis]
RRMDVNDLYERGFAGVHKQTIFSAKDGRPLGKSMALAEVSRKKTAPSLASGFIYPGETGTSRAFQQALNDMRLAAQTDANVYIWGETGSGKELAARAIHQASARRNGPFI